MKTMQVIASHTSLKLEDQCHKGITGTGLISNDAISKRVSLVGYYNIPNALRKLYASILLILNINKLRKIWKIRIRR